VNEAAAANSWDTWIAVFDQVYAGPLKIAEEACHSCGATDLRIAFTGDQDARIGYASFWCQTCLNGICTCRLHIPAGVDVLPFGLPAEERRKLVPNFHLVPPAPTEDDDSESAVF
jgi:hypothetical protein